MSDANASDFVSRSSHRIFQDSASGQPSWDEMELNAVKHDTFVYSRDGERVLFWDASGNNLANWSMNIRAAVETQGL